MTAINFKGAVDSLGGFGRLTQVAGAKPEISGSGDTGRRSKMPGGASIFLNVTSEHGWLLGVTVRT
jgi:hypothetical protein